MARCDRAPQLPLVIRDATVVSLAVILGVIVRASVNRVAVSGSASATPATVMVHVQALAAAACALVGAGLLLRKLKGAGGGDAAAMQEVQAEEEEEQQQEDLPSPEALLAEEPAEPVWDPLQFSADASKRWRMLEIKYGHLSLLANVGLVGGPRCSSTQSTDIDSNCSTESPPPERLLPSDLGESCPSSDREEAERAPRPQDSEKVMIKAPVLEPGAPDQGTDQHPSARDPDKLADVAIVPPAAEGGPRALSGGRDDAAGQLLEPDEEPPPPPPPQAKAAAAPAHCGRAAEAAPAAAAAPPAGAAEALPLALPRGSLWSEFAEDDPSAGAPRQDGAPEQQEDAAAAAPQPELPEEEPVPCRSWGGWRSGSAARSRSLEPEPPPQPAAPQPPQQPAEPQPPQLPAAPQLPAVSDLLPADLEKCPGWRLRAAADLQRGLPQQQAGAPSASAAAALPKKARRNPKDQDLSMQKIMQSLEGVEQDRILIVRKMKKLGFDSAGHLRAHFGGYGAVETVYVSHSHLQGRMRPASLGFVVLDSKESASAALAAGYVQVVRGVAVYIDAFEQLERKERSQA